VAYSRAKQVLVENRNVLDQLAEMLVDKETVDSDELQRLLIDNNVSMASIA
jgi:cell division protease FtsH